MSGADGTPRWVGLVRPAQAGDRAALDVLVREFTPLIWRTARAQGLSTPDAEDVVQTVWLIVVDDLARLRDPQSLPAWLITVTRRQARHVLRARGRETLHPSTELPDRPDRTDLAEAAAVADRDRVLWRAVHRLPERCQLLVLVVAYVDRPDYARLADALAAPHGSVGPTRRRCLDKLRALLRDDPAWSTP
ncbi:MAG TPA: sigma-70 family RNA polymerase sigma factor [Pseudonocardiaceae bacterium]